ncbi:hypothetical protein SEA_MUSETTA_84 [Microbacterium phage Musetta]|nr:hypothetical protein SEA_MUSETTA_84 [Microbacterium phage Musetta]QYC54204.1 hypothetical protein SEA_WELCOME_87 [Microbacterium phage Welcome]URM87488.1 hypothetical protein SEA_DUSTYDINO_89 [Microbacterium phage DustyDino]UVK62499.1 hypothetical protein SEA_YUMA_84 [Microbacterium phage Yuma]
MNTQTAPVCPDCGRLLIVTDNGLTLCPTEDGPAPSMAIVLDGQKMDDPFAVGPGKNIFARQHDIAHDKRVDEWFPRGTPGGKK